MMRRAAVVLIAISLIACTQAPTPSPMKGAWESHVAFTGGALRADEESAISLCLQRRRNDDRVIELRRRPPDPPAYGVWKEVSPNRFQLKYIFYVTKPPSRFEELVGGQGWLPNGHGVITEDITLSADGNSWQSKIHWDAFDMDGKPAWAEATERLQGSVSRSRAPLS
jgi:hypothetical protein